MMEERGGDEDAPCLVLKYRNKRGTGRKCGGSSHGEGNGEDGVLLL